MSIRASMAIKKGDHQVSEYHWPDERHQNQGPKLPTETVKRDNKENCPHCGADLQGPKIPEQHQELYGATHFSRKVGMEVQGAYDGVLYYMCPDCGGRWHRWEEGTRQHELAIKFVVDLDKAKSQIEDLRLSTQQLFAGWDDIRDRTDCLHCKGNGHAAGNLDDPNECGFCR